MRAGKGAQDAARPRARQKLRLATLVSSLGHGGRILGIPGWSRPRTSGSGTRQAPGVSQNGHQTSTPTSRSESVVSLAQLGATSAPGAHHDSRWNRHDSGGTQGGPRTS